MLKWNPHTQLLMIKHFFSNYENVQICTKHASKFSLIGFTLTLIFQDKKWTESCIRDLILSDTTQSSW